MPRKLDLPTCEKCEARLCSIFDELNPEEVQLVAGHKTGNLYKKGQNVFYEGTRPAGLYCLNSGKAKVYKLDAYGKEQIVRLAKAGDVLGYRSLISGELYASFAAALEDSLVCFIPKDVFFKLIQNNPEMSMKVIRLLSQELKVAETRLVDMAQKPVRERLAETLLILEEFYGLSDDGETLDIHLTREDIANIVGTATESVIRYLSEFKQEKIIEIRGRKIKITNNPALVKTANVYD